MNECLVLHLQNKGITAYHRDRTRELEITRERSCNGAESLVTDRYAMRSLLVLLKGDEGCGLKYPWLVRAVTFASL
jgi:hypothetical protein